jgi:hypothetical protein
MDNLEKLDRYRQILQRVVEYHAAMPGEPEDVESIPICDPVHDNYVLMDVGSESNRRVPYIVFHLRLQNGRVRIERDGIEYGIAQDLIDAGIPEEDIVFTFYDKDPRPLAESIAA